MPLEVLGGARATMVHTTSLHSSRGSAGKSRNMHRDGDRSLQFLILTLGMPSKRESSTRAGYVPALCTHCPSIQPMGVVVKR